MSYSFSDSHGTYPNSSWKEDWDVSGSFSSQKIEMKNEMSRIFRFFGPKNVGPNAVTSFAMEHLFSVVTAVSAAELRIPLIAHLLEKLSSRSVISTNKPKLLETPIVNITKWKPVLMDRRNINNIVGRNYFVMRPPAWIWIRNPINKCNNEMLNQTKELPT